MVAQEIANEQQELVGEKIKTTWTLLIKEEDYVFDEKVKKRASVYWDFLIPGHILCIISGKHQYIEEKIEDANFVREFFFSQKGFCAEQNINRDSIYAPRGTITRSRIRSKTLEREREQELDSEDELEKGKYSTDRPGIKNQSNIPKQKQGCICCIMF